MTTAVDVLHCNTATRDGQVFSLSGRADSQRPEAKVLALMALRAERLNIVEVFETELS
jgi:hypothetical protein